MRTNYQIATSDSKGGKMMQELFTELKNFDGRFSRSQYWAYTIGLNFVSGILTQIAGLIPNEIISLLLILSIALPSIYFYYCILVKRSHDLDKSGMFVLLTLIPIVNLYPAILFMFIKGTDGANEYGNDPTVIL